MSLHEREAFNGRPRQRSKAGGRAERQEAKLEQLEQLEHEQILEDQELIDYAEALVTVYWEGQKYAALMAALEGRHYNAD